MKLVEGGVLLVGRLDAQVDALLGRQPAGRHLLQGLNQMQLMVFVALKDVDIPGGVMGSRIERRPRILEPP